MPTTKALSASKFFGKDRYEYYLNELLTQQKVGGNALSKSQIKEGFLKRKDKISFEKFVEKVISTKAAKSTITPPEIKSNPVTGGVGLGSRGGGLVKSPTEALEKYVSGVSKPQKMGGIEDDISKITKSVISIAEILSGQKKLKDSSTSYDRRKAEQEKRSLAESKLEKRFDGLKKAAEKILAPVKSLLDKIINFLVTVFLGRVVYKLLEWFGDPKNADKVKAISRFLGDHWPKLLALYLTFGTSVGRFALRLTKIVATGAIKLLAQILLLSKAKKLRAAGRFLGGKGGKIAAAVLGTAAAVGGAYALTQGLKGDDEEPKTLKPEEPKIPGYAGGGSIKIPAFKGGGFNFKGMFGGALSSGTEKPEEMPNGFVSGEKGVDKVPAMLSDGEFVMSVGAVQKYGVDTLEGMNAAGGGTNKPKMMGGKTYAAGGGPIGDVPEGLLSPDQPWVKKPRPTRWEELKAKLTGGTHNGSTYTSYVNLSGTDADKLIENLKKDPRGYPQVDINGKYGGMENLQKYQKWLKETYLPQSKLTPQPQSKLTPQPQSSTKIGSALDNKPSGGYLGDYMKDKVKMRQATVFERTGESQRLKDLLGVRTNAEAAKIVSTAGNKVPDVSGLLGDKEFSRFNQGAFNKFSEGADEKTFGGLRRIYQQHFGVGEEFSKMMSDRVDAKMQSRSTKPIKPSTSVKPNIEPIKPSTSVKPNIEPIKPSTSVKPNILKNMKVPGGFSAAGLVKGAKTLGVELLLQYFLDKGMNYLDAKRISGIVDKASKAPEEKRDAYIESVRKDLDKEKRHQKSLGGIFDKIIKMGGETGSEYMSKNHEALLSALGSKPYEGSAIKGGFGLKDQSFKDAPKTQIMTDDKGRPFVGYKSMRNGKLHYSRGPQPGTGTSNPFEAFGRAINPGAYKDNDAKLAMQNQRVAQVNSLESYQKQGMYVDAQGRMMKQIGANSNQTQNDLSYRQKQATMAKTKPKVAIITPPISSRYSHQRLTNPAASGAGGGRRSSGAGSQTPSFSARNPSGARSKQETLGLMR